MSNSVSCVACASPDVYAVDQWPTRKSLRAFACRQCGVLFTHPQPHDALTPSGNNGSGEMPQLYPSASMNASAKKGIAGALIAVLDKYFPARQPTAGAKVLDFWCGSGAWLNSFQSFGWETFGIEPSSDAAFARHTRLTEVPTDARFDLVIAYHVLQQVPRPLDALRDLAGAIRPGGYLLVSVPRLDTIGIHRDTNYCLSGRKSIVAFTELSLRGLLARAGLEVVGCLHELDDVWTNGEPVRLRVLARKVEEAAPVHDPAAALPPLLDALAKPVDSSGTEAPIECPACSGANVRLVDEWRLSKIHGRAATCLDCGLLFAHPAPSQQLLDAYYTPDGYAAWKASGTDKAWLNLDTPRPLIRRRTPALLTALDRYLPATNPSGARVLDFGCGPGNWLDRFSDHGWDTYGLEPCTDAAFARHKRLLTVPAEPQFDLVFLYHVLEHLPRPLDTLRELAQAIVPDGYLFVSVPRLDMLPVHREVEYCLHPRHHIVAFTEACLRGLLARAGLDVVASFHESPSAFNRNMPTKLQLLARKVEPAPALEPNPASALTPVIEAFLSITGASSKG